jgi:hypothetical protein
VALIHHSLVLIYCHSPCIDFLFYHSFCRYTLGGFDDECKTVPYMEIFDPCLEARMELMNYHGDFYDAIDFKESMGPKESKFLKTF